MKTFIASILLVLPVVVFSSEVKYGDTVEEVRDALGTPRGQSRMGARELLYFDRGEVELNAGRVTRVALRSEAAQTALEAKRTAEADRIRRLQQTLMIEGEATKTRMLADPAFQASPLGYQVGYWQNFARKYPMVPCSDQLGIAQARLDEQNQTVQREEQARRTAALKEEAKAAREERARLSPYSDSYRDSSNYYPLITSSYGRRSSFFSRDRNEKPSCRSLAPVPIEQKTSSHSAEAFTGKNWMVWPSPAYPARTSPF